MRKDDAGTLASSTPAACQLGPRWGWKGLSFRRRPRLAGWVGLAALEQTGTDGDGWGQNGQRQLKARGVLEMMG